MMPRIGNGSVGYSNGRGGRGAGQSASRESAEVEALVHRAQARDKAAFDLLYQQYSPKIYSYLYYHLNGLASEAEDLTNEVFIKVLQKIDTFQFRGLPFAAWLYRIARNHLVDYLRSIPKQPSLSIDACFELYEERAQRALDNALTAEDLKAALGHLTGEQRQVIVLRFVQGLNTIETALAMDKSEDAVKKLQARGLQMLKKVLTQGRESTRH